MLRSMGWLALAALVQPAGAAMLTESDGNLFDRRAYLGLALEW